jgi:cytochrome c553
MKRIGRLIVAAATVAVAVAALALAASAQGSKRLADVKHGATIAAQGTAAVPACGQCHDAGSLSDGGGGFPRLAGQSAFYLETQMHDFASSQRASPIMSPIAKPLSADDIADVAAYYASGNDPFPPLASAETALIREGAQLARVGKAAKDIQACNNCHGPDGAGIPPAIPYLAGQYAQYIAFQLHAWRRGFRKNSPESMALVAKDLDDREIAAVAAFYQQAWSAAAGVSASK